jgi:two-component system sensor histidine kinase PilS (NtrC family)
LRALFATFVVGTGIVVVRLATPERAVGGLLVVLALMYVSVGAASLARRRGVRPAALTAWQLAADILFIGALGHLAGGAGSHFRLLFFVPLLLGAHYLGARGAVPLAVGASLVTVAGQIAATLRDVGVTPEGGPGGAILDGQFSVFLLLLVGVGAGLQADRAARRGRRSEEAAAALWREQIEVRNVIDNLASGLVIVDRSGRVAQANPAAERILGVYAEEIVGRDLEEAFGDSLDGFSACVREVLAGAPAVARSELTIMRWDTVAVPVGLSVSHLRDATGAVSGVIAVFQDLTEVCRMRERVREADRLAAVGELSASIAHEIRNPLSSIRGSVEILAGELQLSGQQARLLQLILKESARVNTIINDFLAFARMRPARRLPVACDALLADAGLQVRQHVTFHGGDVQVECRCEQAGLVIEGDVEHLTQLLLNLAINACEAMVYTGRLVITAGPSPDREWCELRVMDSGPGLDEEARANLFKPFFTTKKEGTGLGLPMVARIAHAHGGSIEAGVSPAGGAAFTVRIPLAGGATAPTAGAASAPVRPEEIAAAAR